MTETENACWQEIMGLMKRAVDPQHPLWPRLEKRMHLLRDLLNEDILSETTPPIEMPVMDSIIEMVTWVLQQAGGSLPYSDLFAQLKKHGALQHLKGDIRQSDHHRLRIALQASRRQGGVLRFKDDKISDETRIELRKAVS